MSASEITPVNYSAIDVAPLLAYFGVNMLAIVSVGRQDRIVVNNNLLNRARRIMDAYGVDYYLDQVQIIRYFPGVRGQLDNILSYYPTEMYPVEGNAYAIKSNGGGIGILSSQNQGLGIRAEQNQGFGRLNPNSLSASQRADLMQ